MKALTAIMSLLLPAMLGYCAVDPPAAFDAANVLYAQGKFVEAGKAYEEVLGRHLAAPALYFNLGNAFFKSGQLGRAIAAYRQAERLAPRDPDLRANLRFARNQVAGPTCHAGRFETWIASLSADEWTWLSAIAFWLTLFLLFLGRIRPALRLPRAYVIMSGCATLILLACLSLALNQRLSRNIAVVTPRDVVARMSPLDESQEAFTAHDGAELRILDHKEGKEDWLLVTDGTRNTGWVKLAQTVVLN